MRGCSTCARTQARSAADLKEFQANDEVLFGIVADGLDQLLGLVERLVSVVVDGAIFEELACRSLAVVEILEDAVEMVDGVVQFLRKGGILGEFADGTFTGVDLRHQLIGVGHGGIEVVVERVVFEQFAGGAFAVFEIGRDLVQLVDSGVGARVKRVVVDQFAERPLAPAMAAVMVCRSPAMVVTLWASVGSLMSMPTVPSLELSESTSFSIFFVRVWTCSMESSLVRITS